jgi:hypothetical protein
MGIESSTLWFNTDSKYKWYEDAAIRMTLDGANLTVTGNVTATAFYGDGSNLTGVTSTTINNNADNRIITGSGTANTLNAESGLTYNGSALAVTGTITSGAITSSGNLHAGDGTNISMDSSANGQLEVDGNGYQGAIALDGSAMHIYHNSSSRSLVLGTNETARLTISSTGGFNFHSNNLTSVGTISSGAITSSGNSVLTGSGSTGDAFRVNRGSNGTASFRVLNTGEVLIDSNYLYVTAAAGAYFSNSARFRGGITNDTGDLTLADDVVVTGTLSSGNITVDKSNGTGAVVGMQLLSGSSQGDSIAINFGSTTANEYSLLYDHYQNRLNLTDGGSNVFYVAGGVVNFSSAPVFGGGLTVPSLSVTGNGTIQTGAAGLIKGGYYQVGSTTVIDTSRNLTNIANISATGTGTTPFTFTGTSSSLVLKIGSTTQSQYASTLWETDDGLGQIWKTGSAYTAWGGADALNIYNSNGNISFHPSATQSVLQLTSTAINATKPIQISGTTVIDASRNMTPASMVSTNVGTTADRIGNIKIARQHGTNTPVTSIDNLETFILSKTDGGYGAGTKPPGSHNGTAILSFQTHTDNYYTQLALSTNTNDLFIRSANNTTSYGSYSKLLKESSNITVGTISSGAITSSGDLTVNQSAHNYVAIEGNNGSYEAMTRYKNGLANYWYTGLRTSADLVGTTGYHIFSTAASSDVGGYSTAGIHHVKSGYAVGSTVIVDASRNLTNIGTISSGAITAPKINALATGMSEFATNMSSQEDWQNSPISIRERGQAGAGDGEDRDAPNLNFHWGSRVSNSLWMNASGHLAYGDYSSSGVPSADGTFRAGTYQIGSTTVIDGSRNITAGTLTLSADTTDCLNFSSNTTSDIRGISFNSRSALTADYNDGYLRLNNANEFSNGVYTLGNIRADGYVQTGAITINGTTVIDSSRNLTNIGTINSGAITSSGIVYMVTRAEIQGNGGWAYTRLKNSGAVMWDIAANPSDNSSALQFRPSGNATNASLLSTSGNWTINGNISAKPIHIVGTTGGDKLAYASNFEANGANIQLTLERTSSGWGGIGANGSNAFMVYSSDIGLRFGVTQSGSLLADGGTEFLTAARNLVNIGTISSGAITATKFLASGGDSTPAGEPFNNVFKGVSSSRTVYFDGNGSSVSTWYGVGNNPFAAIDCTDGNLATWANDSVGTWRKITEHSASGLNITTGDLLLGDTSTALRKGAGNALRIQTNSGYVDVGAMNSGYCHIDTDRGRFYFNKKLIVNEGIVSSYSQDLVLQRSQNASHQLTLNTSGVTATGNITAYSDERLKTNIQTLDSKKALQMRGVSFIKDGVKGSGVIAQEIEEIAPELVLTADDEMGTKSVAYGNLVGYLIEAIKDQQKQIDELKQRLDNDSSN